MCSMPFPSLQFFPRESAAAGWPSTRAVRTATARQTIPFIFRAPPTQVLVMHRPASCRARLAYARTVTRLGHNCCRLMTATLLLASQYDVRHLKKEQELKRLSGETNEQWRR